MATHTERDEWESRFFNSQQQQFDRFEEKLDKNTEIAKEALSEAKLTNSRVTHLEENVSTNLKEVHKLSNRAIARADRVHKRLVDMENVLVPNKAPEPEDLPIWYKDPKIIKTLVYVSAAVILSAVGLNITDVLRQ